MHEQGNNSAIYDGIVLLYGTGRASDIHTRLMHILDDFKSQQPLLVTRHRSLTERDSMLITYGDMVSESGVPPLATLSDFLAARLGGVVSSVHLLPFFPYSSDDGFSVIDYRKVDPRLGIWEDVRGLQKHFRLMVDGVINHVSARSKWVQAFLRDDPTYRDWFITVEGDPDLSQVVRPRALPLLTRFHTSSGEKAVWTTFSADQIDLNYRNPDVLLEVVDTLLFYVAQGAEFIRLDAIAYLWKEVGTPCIHLSQTHCIIQLLRAVLNEVAPHVKLITETNVPHQDNLSYLGDGYNEAQLVYNFALPPLVLHTLRTGNALALSEWAAGLSLPSDCVTFFNFLASHDGIGLNPARGILTDADIDALVEQTIAHGGRVSYKHNSDGSQSPYELNISYFDALSNPEGDEPLPTQVDRFIIAQGMMLALVGLPGIYFHSLFGSRGWPEGVRLTGHNRVVNRQKLNRAVLEHDLSDPTSLRRLVYERYTHLLKVRASSAAFHPYGMQQIVDCGETIFAIMRGLPGSHEQVLCLHNVSNAPQVATLSDERQSYTDLIAGQKVRRAQVVELAPYQVCWLRIVEGHESRI
jgi:glucosylglycerate phosphorylase